jgi:hypothetical protein
MFKMKILKSQVRSSPGSANYQDDQNTREGFYGFVLFRKLPMPYMIYQTTNGDADDPAIREV